MYVLRMLGGGSTCLRWKERHDRWLFSNPEAGGSIKGDMKVRVKTRLEAQAGALQMATDDTSLPWLP